MRFLCIAFFALALAACAGAPPKPADDSPSGVLKAYVAASQRGDVAAMKSLLSKGSLALIEKSAAAQGKTADELLRQEASVKIAKPPETRGEKIEGEAATVEVRNETNGQYDMVMPLVREDGAWKLARDKYVDEAMRRALEENARKLAAANANAANAANANAAGANANANK